jgi:ceramide glucosyltransferase
MYNIQGLIAGIGLAVIAIAAGYAVLALAAAVAWRLRRPEAGAGQRPVTILKPLCGDEPGLYRHLRSYCEQDYPLFQIVFGARDPADPALDVARRLAAEFPHLSIDIAVSAQQHGGNGKMSNLANMYVHARHDILVMADSDTWVGRDYLAAVTAPLADPAAGLVTCLYHAVATPGLWSRLGAMYVNEWYVPSVLLVRLFRGRRYAFGQTIAMRRDTLEAIGGLKAVSDHIADDYILAEKVDQLGLRIVLSPYMVGVQHHEPDLASMARHELRWMRTTRILRPRSYNFLFVSMSLPLATLGLALSAAAPQVGPPVYPLAWSLYLITAAARLGLHFAQRPTAESGSGRSSWLELCLVPVRDPLICGIWLWSFWSYRMIWRGAEFEVSADGTMRRRP